MGLETHWRCGTRQNEAGKGEVAIRGRLKLR